ncbi:SDR family NAD(P)-dependent oxidoreductase [Hansschlegelia zhihuaiae]|uniref:SDR family NAD(P)-dependent oxidoreductase n=1 Tax=Hansschlegelia zhihuaiae TaxID=405005 RepID=A0A4Q0M2F9_9HYPH|nr:SDR family NAD(P)-dependent oxidoreductase [Hansschlegelia zhihuaiae]RXF67027.1 SDR family NAD(P)-dependent oxidoreductase [Hansschlegelia zhihuaiae]
MAILVTGVAGFIGYHVAARLLREGTSVVGIDNLNSYYSVELKRRRLKELDATFGDAFRFFEVDFADADALAAALKGHEFKRIIHLGAQAGVRYSIQNPRSYAHSNLLGHLNILELARDQSADHLVYASSSSVYGRNTKLPFSVQDRVDLPASLYAATKRADELLSESYAHIFRLPQTGLRFFTVYGPWGRPDMALWLFTDAIMNGRPIQIFNGGEMRRDFTFIDDIVDGVVKCVATAPLDDGELKPGGSRTPHKLYNIGNNNAEELLVMIELLEQACGRKAEREFLPMQPGDVKETYADITDISRDLGFSPKTTIKEGIPQFVDWFKWYHATA